MNIQYVFMLAFAIIAGQSCANHNQYSQQNKNDFKQDIEILIDTSSNTVKEDSSLSKKWFMSLDEALEIPLEIEYLILRGKNYKTFPQEIFAFENLKQLDISLNPLKVLPPNVSQLEKLEELHLAYGELEELPTSIGNMQSLKRLDLLDNNLTTLPNSIGGLVNLTFLNLTMNPIEDLPESMANLKKLERLGLRGMEGKVNPNFTPEKQKYLQALLPNCKITFE